jgi:hypothetical protein
MQDRRDERRKRHPLNRYAGHLDVIVFLAGASHIRRDDIDYEEPSYIIIGK